MNKKWWHNCVVYQVYPRSFMDSNGDGIGDIKGITMKLDYLKELGINVIWLSPVYKSPMDDNGYDISDYMDIAKEFGNMDDMDELIEQAKKRDIKIIMDLVVNHTSDEHPWFIESKKGKSNPYRDYYIWKDPINGSLPNSLTSWFSGSAWELLDDEDQYYFHLFSKRQPDLNWSNPSMRQEIYKMISWWLDKGIGGFRMDVIDLIGKDIDNEVTLNGPTLHKYLKEMNHESFGKYDVLTVGETWGATPELAKLYSDPSREELSMVFQFEHISVFHDEKFGKWNSIPTDFNILKDILSKWQVELASSGWNSLFWNNHDLPRAVSKYGDDKTYRLESAKMLATITHFMKGTPYIYQGEEIGMTNVRFDSFEDYKDIEMLNAYKVHAGSDIPMNTFMDHVYSECRDNARTPMQWSSKTNAGFTTGKPWIKVNPNYSSINVEEALLNKDSIFNYYKQLIMLRKKYDCIIYGDFSEVKTNNPNVYSYIRSYNKEKIIVLVNHTDKNTSIDISLDKIKSYKLMISNYKDPQELNTSMNLRPYESIVFYSKE